VDLKTSSNLFSMFLAMAIGICVALNVHPYLHSHNLWPALITLAGIVILWPILLWLVRKIMRRIKPLSLIDIYGTMLYCVNKGEIEFVDRIEKSEMLEKIFVGQLNRDYIDLRVLEEIKTQKIFRVDQKSHTVLEFKIDRLSFIYRDSTLTDENNKKNLALKFFQYYSNRQRAIALLKDATNQALRDTFAQAFKTEDGRRLIIEADNYDLQEVFEEKLKAVLKKEKHLYELCDSDFDFSFVWTQ
jgi:hypothetical protein